MSHSQFFGSVIFLTWSSFAFAAGVPQDSARIEAIGAVRSFLHGQTPIEDFAKTRISESLKGGRSEAEVVEWLRTVKTSYVSAHLEGARPSGESSARLSFNRDDGGPTELVIEIEEESPYRLVRLETPKPLDKDISPDALAARVKEHVDALAKSGAFSGSILLAKDFKPVLRKSWGYANRRYDVPNKPDTKINLGSANKMFTGVAICQLAEAGLLGFEDRIIDHLPDYPNREVATQVTIHHLLTHTSGMGSYWNDEFEKRWKTLRTVEALIETFVDEPLAFKPGARMQYSNAGPVVLGRIIEVVTGQDYYDYVRDSIYEPASMLNTDCYELDDPVPNLAVGYTRMDPDHDGPMNAHQEGPWRENVLMHTIRGGPAGGGYSTVDDLLAFARAVEEGVLLSDDGLEFLLSTNDGHAPSEGNGYLVIHESVMGHQSWGHNGGAPGINAEFRSYPDDGWVIAILANQDHGASEVFEFVRGLIESQPPPK